MSTKLPLKGGWLAIVPCTAGLGVYLFLIFLPGMREIHSLRADAAQKQQYLAESAARATRQQTVETETAETRDYLQRQQTGPKSTGDAAPLFGELSERFQASGVVITLFRPEAKQPLAVVDRLPLSVSCTGDYDQVQSLLASLEQASRRVWVDEVAIERATGAEAGGKMTCELKLAIFVDNFEILD